MQQKHFYYFGKKEKNLNYTNGLVRNEVLVETGIFHSTCRAAGALINYNQIINP